MDLVLGPVLRRVAGDRATVWVETSGRATVTVRAGSAVGAAKTFCAFDRWYALVVVDGLPPATATPYRVYLDDTQVWPPPGYRYPAPVIRTRDGDGPVRIVFGSCRQASPYALPHLPPDALDAYAVRLAKGGYPWPDLEQLLGDQIYADEVSPATRNWLLRRRRRRRWRFPAPGDQVVDFAEYARLYRESWGDPEIRWLLSTVPSAMIFDDHEIIDDWNISASWRADALATPWWPERITAGLASYWVYQHLGNLAPDELGADPVYPAVVSAADATKVLRDFASGADAERGRYRWSFARDVGSTRLVVLDNRCGRVVEPGQRAMLAPDQWEWFAGTVRSGGYRHLAIGSSLPWLMPYAIHRVETTVSRLAESSFRPAAWAAERLRRGVDLEHWPAFGHSFEDLAALLGQAAAGEVGPVPASIAVLSGDVHHSYVARAGLPGAPVYQVTCSPVHNRVPRGMRAVFRVAWRHGFARDLAWDKLAGPYFGTAVGTIVHSGQSARVTIEGSDGSGQLVPVADVELA